MAVRLLIRSGAALLYCLLSDSKANPKKGNYKGELAAGTPVLWPANNTIHGRGN